MTCAFSKFYLSLYLTLVPWSYSKYYVFFLNVYYNLSNINEEKLYFGMHRTNTCRCDLSRSIYMIFGWCSPRFCKKHVLKHANFIQTDVYNSCFILDWWQINIILFNGLIWSSVEWSTIYETKQIQWSCISSLPIYGTSVAECNNCSNENHRDL